MSWDEGLHAVADGDSFAELPALERDERQPSAAVVAEKPTVLEHVLHHFIVGMRFGSNNGDEVCYFRALEPIVGWVVVWIGGCAAWSAATFNNVFC